MINLSITGDTEQEIDRLAQAAGLTPGQWLRVAVGAAILREAEFGRRPDTWCLNLVPESDLGKALSSFVACQDPLCPDAWAEHERHDRSSQLETAS